MYSEKFLLNYYNPYAYQRSKSKAIRREHLGITSNMKA